jgi:UPF0042 nucleotide-binding protein
VITTTGFVPDSTHVVLVSFGYRNGPPPADAEITVNVQHRFHDPGVDPALRALTARDQEILDRVMYTPGVRDLVTDLAGMARTMTAQLYGRKRRSSVPVTIAVGCTAGRHRSPSIAILTAGDLDRTGYNVHLLHRDIDKNPLEDGDYTRWLDGSEKP